MHYFSRLFFFTLPIFFACSLPLTSESSVLNAPEGLSATFAKDLKKLQLDLIDEEVTGSNVVIVNHENESLYHKVINSGRAGDRDITEETLFPIWSMSKPVTIVAMMTLHEQGLFDWDDPVEWYIPSFANLKVKDEEGGVRLAQEPLRIIHLMTHRSGYDYYRYTSLPDYEQPHPIQSRFEDLAHYVEVVAEYPVEFEPGSNYLYGINQAILGRLVEVFSKRPFEQYLKEALFEPLGMNATSFSLDAERRSRLHPLFINSGNLKGYTDPLTQAFLDEQNYSPDSKAHFGGEGLISCLEDYAKFCEMLVNGGNYRGNQIISQASIDRMTEIVTPNFESNPEMEGFTGLGMGFSVFVLSDPENTFAPKGIFGWSGYHNTHFWIDPTNKLFVVFMSRAREFNFMIPKRLRAAVYGSL